MIDLVLHQWLRGRTPLSSLVVCMRLANIGNGLLMIFIAVLGLIAAGTGNVSGPSGWLQTILLSLYAGAFSLQLLRYELRPSEKLKQEYGFLYTYAGRFAYLLLLGNLAWPIPPAGWAAALATNLNAFFNGYLLVLHPEFTGGRRSRISIGDNTPTVPRDPATQATLVSSGGRGPSPTDGAAYGVQVGGAYGQLR